MSDFCRQCAIQHSFPKCGWDDLAPSEDMGPIPETIKYGDNTGFPALCEGCGPVLTDYLGQCMGGCLGPGLGPKGQTCPEPEKVYRTFAEAQEFLRLERESS